MIKSLEPKGATIYWPPDVREFADKIAASNRRSLSAQIVFMIEELMVAEGLIPLSRVNS